MQELSMLNTKKKIRQLTAEITDSISLQKHSDVITQIVSIYEYALRKIYKRYLGEIKDPEEILAYYKSQDMSMFGRWIGFVRETSFLDEIYYLLNNSKKFTDKNNFVKHISLINKIRVGEVHIDDLSDFDSNLTAKELAYEAENTLMKFLKQFNLYDHEHISAQTKYATVKVQKLIGETQFYESLFEVLHDEDITHLDVTYFSSKLPQASSDPIVGEYWNLVNQKIREEELNLRRIVSVDEHDKNAIKLLWILFNMIPKVYSSLNKNVSISLFKTSASFLDENIVPHQEVNLLNMIIMYNKKNPDQGHLWVFSGHKDNHQEQEYVHIYGSENIVLYQKIYANLLSSSMPLNDATLKGLLNSRAGDINKSNVEEFIQKILKLQDKLQILDTDVKNIIDVYKDILEEDKKDEDAIW